MRPNRSLQNRAPLFWCLGPDIKPLKVVPPLAKPSGSSFPPKDLGKMPAGSILPFTNAYGAMHKTHEGVLLSKNAGSAENHPEIGTAGNLPSLDLWGSRRVRHCQSGLGEPRAKIDPRTSLRKEFAFRSMRPSWLGIRCFRHALSTSLRAFLNSLAGEPCNLGPRRGERAL